MTTVRIIPAPDPERFLMTDKVVWFEELRDQPVEEQLAEMPSTHRFAAEVDLEGTDPATYAGIYGVRDLRVTVPGPRHSLRTLDVPGLTWVGVHPDHRRQGVLRAMMTDHLQRSRSAESGLSALHASEPTIYGRFGYGVASQETSLRLSKGAKLASPGLQPEADRVTTRLVAAAGDGVAARVRDVALRVGADQLGHTVLTEATFDRYLQRDAPDERGTEPRRVLFAVLDGQDVGYAWIRRTQKWEDGSPQGEMDVSQLVGTPAAQLALAQRLVDMDLVGSIEVGCRSTDDLLRHWGAEPRGLQKSLGDSLWLRPCDLPVAMGARRYAGAVDLVLEVEDATLPENAGRWRLLAREDGEGRLERTDAAADVVLDVSQLGRAYLGGDDLRLRRRAGLLDERTPGAVERLDDALRMPSTPMGAIGF